MGNSKNQSSASQYQMNSVKEYPFWTDFFCGCQDVNIFQNLTNINVQNFQQKNRLQLFYKLSNIQPSYLCPITVEQYKPDALCSSQHYRIHYKYIYNQYIPFTRGQYEQLRDQLIVMLKDLQKHHAIVVLKNENLGYKNQKLCYILRWNDVRMSTISEAIQKQVDNFLNSKKKDESVIVRSYNQSNIVFNNRLNQSSQLQMSQNKPKQKDKERRNIYYAGTDQLQQKQPHSNQFKQIKVNSQNFPVNLKKYSNQNSKSYLLNKEKSDQNHQSKTQLMNQFQNQLIPNVQLKHYVKNQQLSKHQPPAQIKIQEPFQLNQTKPYPPKKLTVRNVRSLSKPLLNSSSLYQIQQQKLTNSRTNLKAVKLPFNHSKPSNQSYQLIKQSPSHQSLNQSHQLYRQQPNKLTLTPISISKITNNLISPCSIQSSIISPNLNISHKSDRKEEPITQNELQNNKNLNLGNLQIDKKFVPNSKYLNKIKKTQDKSNSTPKFSSPIASKPAQIKIQEPFQLNQTKPYPPKKLTVRNVRSLSKPLLNSSSLYQIQQQKLTNSRTNLKAVKLPFNHSKPSNQSYQLIKQSPSHQSLNQSHQLYRQQPNKLTLTPISISKITNNLISPCSIQSSIISPNLNISHKSDRKEEPITQNELQNNKNLNLGNLQIDKKFVPNSKYLNKIKKTQDKSNSTPKFSSPIASKQKQYILINQIDQNQNNKNSENNDKLIKEEIIPLNLNRNIYNDLIKQQKLDQFKKEGIRAVKQNRKNSNEITKPKQTQYKIEKGLNRYMSEIQLNKIENYPNKIQSKQKVTEHNQNYRSKGLIMINLIEGNQEYNKEFINQNQNNKEIKFNINRISKVDKKDNLRNMQERQQKNNIGIVKIKVNQIKQQIGQKYRIHKRDHSFAQIKDINKQKKQENIKQINQKKNNQEYIIVENNLETFQKIPIIKSQTLKFNQGKKSQIFQNITNINSENNNSILKKNQDIHYLPEKKIENAIISISNQKSDTIQQMLDKSQTNNNTIQKLKNNLYIQDKMSQAFQSIPERTSETNQLIPQIKIEINQFTPNKKSQIKEITKKKIDFIVQPNKSQVSNQLYKIKNPTFIINQNKISPINKIRVYTQQKYQIYKNQIKNNKSKFQNKNIIAINQNKQLMTMNKSEQVRFNKQQQKNIQIKKQQSGIVNKSKNPYLFKISVINNEVSPSSHSNNLNENKQQMNQFYKQTIKNFENNKQQFNNYHIQQKKSNINNQQLQFYKHRLNNVISDNYHLTKENKQLILKDLSFQQSQQVQSSKHLNQKKKIHSVDQKRKVDNQLMINSPILVQKGKRVQQLISAKINDISDKKQYKQIPKLHVIKMTQPQNIKLQSPKKIIYYPNNIDYKQKQNMLKVNRQQQQYDQIRKGIYQMIHKKNINNNQNQNNSFSLQIKRNNISNRNFQNIKFNKKNIVIKGRYNSVEKSQKNKFQLSQGDDGQTTPTNNFVNQSINNYYYNNQKLISKCRLKGKNSTQSFNSSSESFRQNKNEFISPQVQNLINDLKAKKKRGIL